MKIYVGSAIWRSVEVGHMKSLVPLLRTPGVQYAPQTGDALIERARGISATHFLRESDADVHLSIDSDITGFTVEDTLKLCSLAMDYDIVAAAYVTRSADKAFPTAYYEQDVRVNHAFDHTPVEIKWAATGFLAVHRRVFETLAKDLTLLHASEPWAFYNFYGPTEYQDDETEPILLSEDYAFCQRAKDAGFKVYLDPAVRIGHIGSYVYRLEDTAQKQIEPQPIALTRTGKKRWTVESIEMPAAGNKTATHPRSVDEPLKVAASRDRRLIRA